jgi:hypothetical protein
LGEVITRTRQMPFEAELFLPESPIWTLDGPALLVESDTNLDPDSGEDINVHNDMKHAFSIFTVEDVLENLVQQRPGADLSEMLSALRFYYERDAFIVLPKVRS